MARGGRLGDKRLRMKYTVVVEREADGGFVVTVPVLPGCISQGDTREEALSNIREAIDVYIESLIASGDPVPVEDSRKLLEVTASAR